MSAQPELPNGWVVESEKTTFDSMMGRNYTTVHYRQPETGASVRIFEVSKANTRGYQALASGRDGNLGTADDLDAAKELARTFMNDSQAA